MNIETDIMIRDATIGDVPAILEMVRELAEYEKKDVKSMPLNANTLIKYGYSADPYFWILVAEDKQKNLIGYALYYFTFRPSEGAPILYVEDIYVKAAHRKQGIGRKLLSSLANITINKECAYMEGSVFAWNEATISLYQTQLKAELRRDLIPVRLRGENLIALADTSNTLQPS
jgi:L-amino acid N-acyltransferase YncA